MPYGREESFGCILEVGPISSSTIFLEVPGYFTSVRRSLISLSFSCIITFKNLCHTVEKNHSAAFWKLVGKVCPAYPTLRARLRKYNTRISQLEILFLNVTRP